MSQDAGITFFVLAVTVALFVSDRLRLDVVALLSALALVLSGVISTEAALAGFANPSVVMIAGLFVIGSALTETGLTAWLGRKLEAVAGAGEARVVISVMLATAALSAFMSSTGTVALMLPIAGTIAAQRGLPLARLLMPLAFASHLGSTLTLISTPPNLIVSEALRAAGREPLHFFSFTPAGVVTLVAGVGYMTLFGRRLLRQTSAAAAPSRLSTKDLAAGYGLATALAALRVPPASRLVGRTLGEADLRARFGVSVVAIVRGDESVGVVPRARFEADDALRVLGADDAIGGMAAELGLERVIHTPRSFELPTDESLVEVVLPRRSRLIGQTLRASRFRDRYRANVLAVRRDRAGGSSGAGGELVSSPLDLRDVTLRGGDTLLLKGRRKYLKNIRDERADLVLLAEPDQDAVIVDRPRAAVTALVTTAMLVVMAFGWIPNAIAVLSAAFILVLTRAVRPAEVYRSINWESVVLIACMIPLAGALERTGGTATGVNALERALHGASPHVVLALLVALTSALGMVLSNTATAVLLAPVALRLAAAFAIPPEPLLVGVALGASAAFATPIASPVNVLVMTPGGYTFRDYVRVGLPMQLVVFLVTVLVVPLVWPLR